VAEHSGQLKAIEVMEGIKAVCGLLVAVSKCGSVS